MHAVVLDSGVADATFVRNVLRSLEFAPQVTAVETGSELVVAIRRGQVDLVLTPYEVPDMLFRRLRYHLDACSWRGVIGVFAGSDRELERALQAGASFGLRRPLQERTLIRALHHFHLLDPGEPVPAMEDVEDSWSIALRRPFELRFTTDPIDLERPGAVWLAEYGPEEGPITALTVLEEGLGFGLGAAVSLLPPVVSREALRRRARNEQLSRNLALICGLLTDLYDDTDGLRLRNLRRTAHVPRTIRTRAREDRRLDLEVDLRDYGRGRAAFLPLERTADEGVPRRARRSRAARSRNEAPAGLRVPSSR